MKFGIIVLPQNDLIGKYYELEAAICTAWGNIFNIGYDVNIIDLEKENLVLLTNESLKTLFEYPEKLKSSS